MTACLHRVAAALGPVACVGSSCCEAPAVLSEMCWGAGQQTAALASRRNYSFFNVVQHPNSALQPEGTATLRTVCRGTAAIAFAR